MLDLQPIGNDREAIQSNMALRHFDDRPIGPGASLLQGHGPVGGAPLCPEGARPEFRSGADSTPSARGRASPMVLPDSDQINRETLD